MSDKDMAINQINQIHATIENAVRATISGPHMVAIGCGVAAIPLFEIFLAHTLDPLIQSWNLAHTTPLLFGLRTIFYWSLFANIARMLPQDRTVSHPFIQKLMRAFRWYPLIPITTAALLAQYGYVDLIAPIVLILIGSLHVIIGQFAPWIMSAVAWSWIGAGLIGIALSTMQIPYLWQGLVIFQGIGLIIIGLYAYNTERA